MYANIEVIGLAPHIVGVRLGPPFFPDQAKI
jgi:hypothetical protein